MTGFDARMAALQARFVAQAAEEGAAITAALAAADRERLRTLSHGLSGRAGMFGFAALGEAARATEEAIDDGAGPEQVCALAEVLLRELRLAQGR